MADDNAPRRKIVMGKEAEQMIIEGTVLDSFSTEVQYGVKYYYSVLLCQKAYAF